MINNISTYTTFCIFQYGGATCTRHIIDMSYLGVIDVYGLNHWNPCLFWQFIAYAIAQLLKQFYCARKLRHKLPQFIAVCHQPKPHTAREHWQAFRVHTYVTHMHIHTWPAGWCQPWRSSPYNTARHDILREYNYLSLTLKVTRMCRV